MTNIASVNQREGCASLLVEAEWVAMPRTDAARIICMVLLGVRYLYQERVCGLNHWIWTILRNNLSVFNAGIVLSSSIKATNLSIY